MRMINYKDAAPTALKMPQGQRGAWLMHEAPCGRPPIELRGQEPGGTACCRPQYQGRRHGVPPIPGIGARRFGQAQSAGDG